mmetsp:Transcript_138877/g.443414  ORF Transcript_138877/g.443414 Transcript_138877/m.443414 type:complete len:167 (-) Transcript_138877:208-708(-)
MGSFDDLLVARPPRLRMRRACRARSAQLSERRVAQALLAPQHPPSKPHHQAQQKRHASRGASQRSRHGGLIARPWSLRQIAENPMEEEEEGAPRQHLSFTDLHVALMRQLDSHLRHDERANVKCKGVYHGTVFESESTPGGLSGSGSSFPSKSGEVPSLRRVLMSL